MATPEDLFSLYFFSDKTAFALNKRVVSPVVIKKVEQEKQLVYGEVYAPDIIDTHGHIMSAEEVEKLAHAFMLSALNSHVDLMHNNKPANVTVVESFVARKGDPDFTEGAWVAVSKVHDPVLWAEIKQGKYNGYSMEVMVHKEPATVEIMSQKNAFGIVEENNGHYHAFYIELDESARVVRGKTSEDDGHYHEITMGTAVEFSDNHTHRFFIP